MADAAERFPLGRPSIGDFADLSVAAFVASFQHSTLMGSPLLTRMAHGIGVFKRTLRFGVYRRGG